jgi:hypothetical protein
VLYIDLKWFQIAPAQPASVSSSTIIRACLAASSGGLRLRQPRNFRARFDAALTAGLYGAIPSLTISIFRS